MTADNFVSRLVAYSNCPLLRKNQKSNSSQFLSKTTALFILSSPAAVSVYSLINTTENMHLSDDTCRKLSSLLRFSSSPSISV